MSYYGLLLNFLLTHAILNDPVHGFELVRPGNARCYYTSPIDGTEQPYFLYVPFTLNPDRPAPVVLFLHGFGGRTGPAATSNWMVNWANSHGWILVNLDGRGSQNWDGIGEDDIFFVVEDLQRTTRQHPALNIDSKRIYLQGCSMGGHGCFREGFRYPDVFAAIAPGAGWTTYLEFYNHWYDAYAEPHLPEYTDPARLPALETASSLWQAENARWVWTLISFDRNDWVNPPVNHDLVIEELSGIGSDRYAVREGFSGHCGSFCTMCNFRFFLGKRVKERPAEMVYATNDLRYNRAYWVSLDRFRYLGQWARLEVHARRQKIRAITKNLLAFSLHLERSPLNPDRSVTIEVDGWKPFRCPGNSVLRLEARVDHLNQITGWSLRSANAIPSAPVKRPGLAGPIADAFRSRFLVIYGTRGGSRPADPSNPDWVAAQKFCTEWNQWTALHWGRQEPPPARAEDWWIPPYPFSPGAHIPEHQPLVLPLPDTAFGLDTLPRNANLALFGDPDTHWVIAQAAPNLPLTLSSRQVRVRERVYEGDNINYIFIAPSPFDPAHYLVIARGYLTSDIDPGRYTAGNVGKDLEALPFYWPDYVVWDGNTTPARTVQDPLKYLPETFLDAGYFNEQWQIDISPPVSSIAVSQKPVEPDGIPVIEAALTAADRPGGFGVHAIEWRMAGGDWQRYRSPFRIASGQPVRIEVRAADRCGQFIYDPSKTPRRGVPATGNLESSQSFTINPLTATLQ